MDPGRLLIDKFIKNIYTGKFNEIILSSIPYQTNYTILHDIRMSDIEI